MKMFLLCYIDNVQNNKKRLKLIVYCNILNEYFST